MAWQVKKQYVDKAIGHHVVHLHEPTTGAEHLVQIIVGQEPCFVCGHVRVVDNVDVLNPREIIAHEIEQLEKGHAQSHGYAQKHNVPIAKGE